MDRVVFALYRALSALLCALPLTAVFRLGWALGSLAYWVAPPYRRLVLHNLTIAFGREKSPAELRALARKHFATLGANIFSSTAMASSFSMESKPSACHTGSGVSTMKVEVVSSKR